MQPNQPETNNGVPNPAANAWPQQPGPPQQAGFPPQPGMPQQQQPLYGAQPQPVYGMPVDNNAPAAYGQPAAPNYPPQNPGVPVPAASPDPAIVRPKGEPQKSMSDKLGTPSASLGLGVFSVFIALLFLNLSLGLNIWIKLILLLILSSVALVASLKAYKKVQSGTVVVGLIISVWVLVSTLMKGFASL